MSTNATAIHFGAGNIGRGFIGPLLADGGYHVIFADINETLIDELDNQDEYRIHFLDPTKKRRPMTMTNYSGVLTNNSSLITDFANPEVKLVTTSVGLAVLPKIAPVIARGISERRKAGRKEALNVIACENGVGATEQLHQAVLKHLSQEDKQHVGNYVGFANCAVDRIVPPFETDAPLDVGVESFYEWSVDRTALKGVEKHQSLGIRGMHLTEDLPGYVERKLFTLNCGHATAAYLGYLKGCDTILDSIKHKEISDIVEKAMNESAAALVMKHPMFTGEEQDQYVKKCMDRFANTHVVDQIQRVGRDPLRKLARNDRLLGPIFMALEHNLPISNLYYGVAAALLYDCQDDPQAVELQDKIRSLGIEKTIVELSGFKDDSTEFNNILDTYHKLETWKRD